MTKIAAAALLSVFALSLPSAHGQSSDPKEDLIWADESLNFPRFIPEGVLVHSTVAELKEGNVDGIAFATDSISTLAYFVQSNRDRHQGKPGVYPPLVDGCFKPPVGDTFTEQPQPGSLTFKDLVLRSDLSVTGVVRRAVPGWYTGLSVVATLVFLEVDQVLRDTTGKAVPGQEISFLQLNGGLQIEEVRVCTVIPGQLVVRKGDRIVLNAVDDSEHSRFVWAKQWFLLHDGKVLPNPDCKLLSNREAISLTALKKSVAAGQDRP